MLSWTAIAESRILPTGVETAAVTSRANVQGAAVRMMDKDKEKLALGAPRIQRAWGREKGAGSAMAIDAGPPSR